MTAVTAPSDLTTPPDGLEMIRSVESKEAVFRAAQLPLCMARRVFRLLTAVAAVLALAVVSAPGAGAAERHGQAFCQTFPDGRFRLCIEMFDKDAPNNTRSQPFNRTVLDWVGSGHPGVNDRVPWFTYAGYRPGRFFVEHVGYSGSTASGPPSVSLGTSPGIDIENNKRLWVWFDVDSRAAAGYPTQCSILWKAWPTGREEIIRICGHINENFYHSEWPGLTYWSADPPAVPVPGMG